MKTPPTSMPRSANRSNLCIATTALGHPLSRSTRNIAVALGLAAALSLVSVAAAVASERPSDCPPRFASCLDRAEAEAVARQQVELDYLRKLRGKRLGATLGPGIGISGVVTDDYEVHWVPSGGVYLVWGIRF